MKKTLLILLCGILMLSLFACDGSNKDDSSKGNEPPKNNQGQKPEVDPPEWEELIDEYDEWANECVNYRKSYEKDPENPVNQNMLKKWPRDIYDWEQRVAEMFDELKDFSEEKGKFVDELKKISTKLTGVEITPATQEEIDTFINEYKAWADEYVAFEEENKDNKVSQAYKRARNDYVFELAYWGNMTANFNLRIEDADALESFNAEIAKIDEKAATLIN